MLSTDARCATVFQDVPGTARGCWFASGTATTYPEDPHLALVTSNTRPWESVFSVGTSVPGLSAGTYTFSPQGTGVVNRAFEDITADGEVYAFRVDGFDGVLLLTMPDGGTLWLEAVSGGDLDPALWEFTSTRAIFER